jgi:hypothetical protein
MGTNAGEFLVLENRKRRATMKRIIWAVFAVAVLGTLLVVTRTSKHGVSIVHAEGGCSLETLRGSYGFNLGGFFALDPKDPNSAFLPIVDAGRITFDGAGNFTGSDTGTANGQITDAFPIAGTYAVNSDCTGTSIETLASGTPGSHFTFVIVNGGREVVGVETDPGTTRPLESKRVGPRD